MIDLKELREAEALVKHVEDDPMHAANDKKHPRHEVFKSALIRLKTKIRQTHSALEAQKELYKITSKKELRRSLKDRAKR